MPTYSVVRKTDGAEVYRYVDAAPVEFVGMEFADFDHVELSEEAASPSEVEDIVMTRLAFLNRFTNTELAGIMMASDTSPELRVWITKMQVAEDITLSNPDTIAGVQSLEAAGLLAPGRAQEILNG